MIPGLDGLRAIAFLMLLGLHTGNLDFGWMGVQLFFVLSGFLITGILLRMKETFSARQFFYKFYGRRFLRIFPLYYFYLLILTIAIWQSDFISSVLLRNEIQDIVRFQLSYAYFYIYDFFHASSVFRETRFLTHLWSLSVEEQFYILWPLVLFFTRKEKLKSLFLFTIILGPVLRLLTYFIYHAQLLRPAVDDPYLAIYVLPFSHVDAFAMGAYISCYQLPNPRKQLALLVSVIPLLGFSAQYFATGRIQLNTIGYEFTLFTAYKFVWGYSVLNYFFALMIHAVDQTKLFTDILDHFIISYLGKISYGLYVYHFPVLWFILAIQLKYGDQLGLSLNVGGLRIYIAALILTTIIASISFRLFEKPINNLKDTLFPLKPT